MIFGHLISSLVHDVFIFFKDSDYVDFNEAIDFIHRSYIRDFPEYFTLTLKSNIEVKFNKMFKNERGNELVRRFFRVGGAFERFSPPVNVRTRVEFDEWVEQIGVSRAFLREHFEYFYLFMDAFLTCCVLSELFTLCKTKGKNVRVFEQMIPLEKCEIAIGTYVVCHEIPCFAFFDATSKMMNFPFQVEYSESKDECGIRTSIVRLNDEIYLNPWDFFINSKEFQFRELERFQVTDIQQMSKYVTEAERNIRSCWMIEPTQFLSETPGNTKIASMVSQTFVACIDIPSEIEGETNGLSDHIHDFTVGRETLSSLIDSCFDKHIFHILSRSTSSNDSTVTYIGECEYRLIFVTVLMRLGTRYEVVTIAITSDDPERFQGFYESHKIENGGLDESYFTQLAIAVHRNFNSGKVVVRPIPVKRMFFYDPFVPFVPTNWFLNNCKCVCCLEKQQNLR